MCMYSDDDIKRAIERTYDMLHPLYLFCNPIHFEGMKKELSETMFEIVSSAVVEEDKILIVNKADLKYPFENSDLPKINLKELKQFIDKGGEE